MAAAVSAGVGAWAHPAAAHANSVSSLTPRRIMTHCTRISADGRSSAPLALTGPKGLSDSLVAPVTSRRSATLLKQPGWLRTPHDVPVCLKRSNHAEL